MPVGSPAYGVLHTRQAAAWWWQQDDVCMLACVCACACQVYSELTASHTALTNLLAVKDQMISHLLQERNALQVGAGSDDEDDWGSCYL